MCSLLTCSQLSEVQTLNLEIDRTFSMSDGTASNTNHTSHRSSQISRQEVNFDELPYDPADRRRISDYIGDQLQNDVRRKYLTRGPCKPPPGFKFPVTMIAGFPRRCQHEWFNKYGWLEYSEKMNKCFCLYCYLFRDCNKGQGGNDAFVIDGWDGYNKSDRLRDHVGSKCNSFHNTAVKICDNLLKPGQSIGEAINKQSNITKENHLIRLNASIKAVPYLLHQGLAFCGHDETEESTNKGNFRELVQLLAEENDKVKKVVGSNTPKNNKMIAPELQRDIVNCFAEIIVKSIIEEIGGDVFCLLVDESADVSGKEQIAVILRYVDKFRVLKERLIAVVHVQETSGSCLKSNIDNLFANNMRGEFNGLRALIVKENNSAHYIHCFAHQLQLVIVAVAKKNDDASDFFDMISLLLTVAGASCKRKYMVREKQQERVRKAIGSGQLHSGTGLNQEQSLQRAGDTRWGSHYKTLKNLSNLFPEIIEVLQYVEKEGPNDAKRRQARGLLDYLKDFDFVFHLHLMMLILGHANCLSLSLQRKDKGILEAMLEVKLTKQKFQQIRDDGCDSLLQDVQSFCEKHGIPKLDMDEEYIDHFNDRFKEANSQLLTHIAAFNPKNSFEAFKFESLMELAKSYPDDFDSTQLRDLGRELNIYIDNVKADERFANLNTIFELAKLMVVLVLPVATASVEMCFSAMKIVKTILRNRIGDGFLNDCMVCFVEQEFLATIPIDDVITRFHKMEDRNRRGNL
ncbi:hypothetical protein PVAP13_8NG211002 [Panicum virgatum]|uniref:TTF-type domain-containing protein n=1 Tax=Panicum virgatum TaxID=38727 RepID=A0A8T0P9X2_PANVG|nr:hypothetical protein PVAP13_8NG211002 [Panicum virgatum]